MAILFSEVTVSAGSDSQEFLVAGIPTEYEDLEDNSCAEQFLAEIDSETEVSVHVEVYLYGDGETVQASEDDLVKIKDQIRHDPSFLGTHCDNIEDMDFSFNWCPEELFNMKM
mgnify:FL=1